MNEVTGEGYTRSTLIGTLAGLVRIPGSPAELDPPDWRIDPSAISFRWTGDDEPDDECEGAP